MTAVAAPETIEMSVFKEGQDVLLRASLRRLHPLPAVRARLRARRRPPQPVQVQVLQAPESVVGGKNPQDLGHTVKDDNK